MIAPLLVALAAASGGAPSTMPAQCVDAVVRARRVNLLHRRDVYVGNATGTWKIEGGEITFLAGNEEPAPDLEPSRQARPAAPPGAVR
jgi:hypothetical protein